MRVPLILVTIMFVFMVQSLGRTIYVNYYEFLPAKAEWHAAYDRGDRKGMNAAFKKEVIANCRSFDPLWFYGPLAVPCSR